MAVEYEYRDGHTWFTLTCSSCDHPIKVPAPCGNRFCDVCSISRRNRIRKKIELMCENIRQYTGEKFRFLTLTIKSEQSLFDMCKFLIASFRRLRQTKLWKKHVSGGAYVIEFVPSKSLSGYWHAHLHVIFSATFIDITELRALWFKCSGGGRHVNIELISRKDIARYLTKYATKAANCPPERIEEVGIAMKGIRMFQPFGIWHNAVVKVPKSHCICPHCGNDRWRMETTETAQYRQSLERASLIQRCREIDRERKAEYARAELAQKLADYIRPD